MTGHLEPRGRPRRKIYADAEWILVV